VTFVSSVHKTKRMLGMLVKVLCDDSIALILGQCSRPGGIVFLSRLIACVMRRQTAEPVSSPADASSSARPVLSVCALSRVA
jgi:hypothetical protein